jgi:hypothetical protein
MHTRPRRTRTRRRPERSRKAASAPAEVMPKFAALQIDERYTVPTPNRPHRHHPHGRAVKRLVGYRAEEFHGRGCTARSEV